jgi:hypothetical protein
MVLKDLPRFLGVVKKRRIRDGLLKFVKAHTALGDEGIEIEIHGG